MMSCEQPWTSGPGCRHAIGGTGLLALEPLQVTQKHVAIATSPGYSSPGTCFGASILYIFKAGSGDYPPLRSLGRPEPISPAPSWVARTAAARSAGGEPTSVTAVDDVGDGRNEAGHRRNETRNEFRRYSPRTPSRRDDIVWDRIRTRRLQSARARPQSPRSPSPGVPVTSSSSTRAAGTSFGSRYHIIRLLGVGGMGAVYQAWDAELGVAVAIKVIRPEITADPASARGDRAPLQARTAAGAPGHAQERRAHPRPRRDRRHQVHHDAVHRGQRSRDAS